MRKKYLQFILRLTILSLVLGFVAIILSRLLPGRMISPALPYLFLLFYVISALVHFVLLRITALNPRKFVSYFMLTTFFKLMNYLIVILVYVLYVKEGILPFILSFFILYIIYTLFEVVTILAQTKDKA
jgi:hypothetical protein